MKMRAGICALIFVACASREARDTREANAVTIVAVAADAAIAPRADATLERMSAARELSIEKPVAHVALSREALLAKVRAHVARAVPREEIAREDAFLKGMAAIPRDASYESLVYDALRSALGGMYEPLDGAMYLPDDAREDSLTVAHESVHALQDQHFDLSAWERYAEGASDEMLARACLAEGDAVVAAGESPSAPDGGGYVEREIAAPYVAGAAFVRALRARGGWDTVNRAWTRSGLTTSQVLHPEKWFAEERAEIVPKPKTATLGAAYRATFDVEGELAVMLVLGAYFASKDAARVAEGWAGDASCVARAGERAAVAWRIRWEDEAGAARAMNALARGANDRCDAGFGDSMFIGRRARDVLLLAGPPGGSCALLERWAKEIFSE